jgi:signal transduction histidine kinase
VRSAALRSSVPTSVETEGLGACPDEISTAVYFCCVEALQNVAKHAPEARSARIVLREADSVLRFSVTDDGPGLVESSARVGGGMLNMRDRMTTVGGRLTVQSRSGEGTRVTGRVPLSAVARAAPDRVDRLAPSRKREPHQGGRAAR